VHDSLLQCAYDSRLQCSYKTTAGYLKQLGSRGGSQCEVCIAAEADAKIKTSDSPPACNNGVQICLSHDTPGAVWACKNTWMDVKIKLAR
jgi:hypothetical protein